MSTETTKTTLVKEVKPFMADCTAEAKMTLYLLASVASGDFYSGQNKHGGLAFIPFLQHVLGANPAGK